MNEAAEWHIYRGAPAPHDGIERLKPPPPWREFNGPVLEQFVPEAPSGAHSQGNRYLPEPDAVELTNVALLLRRPLLVTGKPGTGKSTLAHSIAHELKLGPVLYWPITTRSQLQDALYRYDPIARLQRANLTRGEGRGVPSVGEFIRLGPLGTALLGRERPRVLLVDELDKSDIDLPNDLLNVLETGWFEILELTREAETGDVRVQTADPGGWAMIRNAQVRCRAFPMIVITSNGEREFPPPFLRRCVRVNIQQPSADKLSRIVSGQLGDPALSSAGDVVEEFVSARERMDLSTDQLLNAVYFATSGLQLDGQERLNTVRRIFRDLGPGAEA